MFWLLGAINAINLIDGIDGLASSVGLVLCLAVAALTAYQGSSENFSGNYGATLIALTLGGALLGFLRYNFAPASIFLGDAGSMLIGLVLGAVAIQHQLKTAATVALAVPVAVWSIPIVDSAAAILRRQVDGAERLCRRPRPPAPLAVGARLDRASGRPVHWIDLRHHLRGGIGLFLHRGSMG